MSCNQSSSEAHKQDICSNNSSITKYLLLPPSTATQKKSPFPKARLLTSVESLKLLEDKENKKRVESEEKERRKKEREEKKKQKDAEAKKRAEERVRKAEEKSRIAAEKERKNAKGKRQTLKRKKDTASIQPTCTPKRHKNNAEEINSNICCACFVDFEKDVRLQTRAEWLMCACGRWLHELCIKERRKDKGGEDRICPLCLDILQ